ncbi:hypothetical protein L7F22_042924 [Adiantum nelumboides]|nr:hypothetical protein [Adiantum nelumboides]
MEIQSFAMIKNEKRDKILKLHQSVGSGDERDVLFQVPFLLDSIEGDVLLDIQFGNTFIVSGDAENVCGNVALSSTVHTLSVSIVDIIEKLPSSNALRIAYGLVSEKISVTKLPYKYNGNILFEFPPIDASQKTQGTEVKFDGHLWCEDVTTNISNFNAIVRLQKCGGHLMCNNALCSYLARTGIKNEIQWKGLLLKVPEVNKVTSGTLQCLHCKSHSICKTSCSCKMYLWFPKDQSVTRCVIHIGYHMHPVSKGASRKKIENLKTKVAYMLDMAPETRPKAMQKKIAEDIVLEAILSSTSQQNEGMSDAELALLFERLRPTLDTKRLSKLKKEAKEERWNGERGLDSILTLKSRSKIDFIQSVIFLGQLSFSSFERCHVFKMTIRGPGSGVDIVNKMRPVGELDLTNDVAEKIGVARAHEAVSRNTTTVRKKRPRTLSTPIHVNDSHILEYQKVNRHLQRRQSISNPLGGAERNDDKFLVQEEEINQTMWAIHRTNPVSVARCRDIFQMIYFCGDSVDHSWNPTNAIHGIPRPAPTRWVVAKGTTLTVDEVKKFQQDGFVLDGMTEEKSTKQPRRVHTANVGGKARPEF